MAEPITKEEFRKIVGSGVGSHPQLHSDQEWWSGNGRVGVLILDKVDQDWSWVALAKAEDNSWRAYNMGASSKTSGEARKAMLLSFNTELKPGWSS